MNKVFASLIIAFFCLVSSGCGNLSPRDNLNPKSNQNINNENGKIDRIETNQNAIRIAAENRNETTNNGGVQILQGDSGLILIFGIIAIICVTVYFYQRSLRIEKINTILSDQIKSTNDPALEENVLKAALYTNVEKEVYQLIAKKK